MLQGENYRRRECQERALRLRGLEDGGVGGNGLLNLTWKGEEVTVKLGTEFCLVWVCLRGVGLDLAEMKMEALRRRLFIFAGGEK
jgi:hypothetical protein